MWKALDDLLTRPVERFRDINIVEYTGKIAKIMTEKTLLDDDWKSKTWIWFKGLYTYIKFVYFDIKINVYTPYR